MFGRALLALAVVGLAPVAVADEKLTEEQAVQVSTLFNQNEIDMARLVPSRAQSAAIKQFAEQMLIDHSSAKHNTEMVIGQLRLMQDSSPVAAELKRDNQTTVQMLQDRGGADFDRGYIDQQVKGHAKVLQLLDEKLIPAARDPAVKKLFADMRPVVEHHLKMAQRLQGSLGVH